jgi:excisionase family DNA binding protein
VNQLLTYKETMDFLRLGKSKMAELVRVGELKSVKVGSRRLFTSEALENFVERNST